MTGRIERRHLSRGGAGRDGGQVLLEFAIVVPVFIIICVGAIPMYRYLQFDWQAQKEARYLAFSQTFAGTNPMQEVAATPLGRPKYVQQAQTFNYVVQQDSLTSFIDSPQTGYARTPRPIKATPPNLPNPHQSIRLRPGSNFDRQIDSAYRTTASAMRAQYLNVSNNYTRDPRVAKMKSMQTYVGTANALTAFDQAVRTVAAADPQNLNPAAQYRVEQAVADGLYRSAAGSSFGPISRNGFSLSNVVFANISGIGAFEGLMSNVLAENGGNKSAQITNSIIRSGVVYFSAGTEKPDPKRHFADVSASNSRFTLVTGTWDVPRRVSSLGAWRVLGDQTDTADNPSEEGILRKNTRGLWLIPSDPVALMRPATDLLPSFMQGPASFIEGPARSAIVEVKKIVLDDNPLQMIFNLLNSLPIISELDLNLPQWPSVRPQAYPNSNEMNGDRMTGGTRTFNDYVNEQAGR